MNVCLSGIALTLTACGTAVSYTQTDATAQVRSPRLAADVDVFLTGPPQRAYQEIGFVEARQEFLSSDDSAAIMDELRRAAALQGCDGVVVSAADAVTGTGFASNGTGSMGVRSLHGFRGVCIVYSAGGGRIGAASTDSAPLGALGYRFDDSFSAAKERCDRIAGAWAVDEDGDGSCNRLPPNMSFAGETDVEFCQGKLCAIEVVAPFDAGASDNVVLTRWGDVKRDLEKHYGAAFGGRVSRPEACASRVLQCISTKQAEYRLEWKWKDGHRVELALETESNTTALHVRYEVKAATSDRDVQGLEPKGASSARRRFIERSATPQASRAARSVRAIALRLRYPRRGVARPSGGSGQWSE